MVDHTVGLDDMVLLPKVCAFVYQLSGVYVVVLLIVSWDFVSVLRWCERMTGVC
jgi:hypothetical protein